MIINKTTSLRSAQTLTDEDIQLHLDIHNEDGWYLISVDNISGWYRFFWAKAIE